MSKTKNRTLQDLYRYNNEFVRENYDRVSIVAPKGMKERIKAAAKARGVSANKYIIDLITRDLGAETAAAKPIADADELPTVWAQKFPTLTAAEIDTLFSQYGAEYCKSAAGMVALASLHGEAIMRELYARAVAAEK